MSNDKNQGPPLDDLIEMNRLLDEMEAGVGRIGHRRAAERDWSQPGAIVVMPGQLEPIQWGKSPATLSAARQQEHLVSSAQAVISLGNLHADELPETMRQAIGALNAALAGPGPDALNKRPGSMEVVNDPGLHERALAEAKSREMKAGQEYQTRALAFQALPSEVQHLSREYDERLIARENDINDAFVQGQAKARYDVEREVDETPVLKIIGKRIGKLFDRRID